MGLKKKKTYGHDTDKNGRLVVVDETFNPRKGDLYMEGTTKRGRPR